MFPTRVSEDNFFISYRWSINILGVCGLWWHIQKLLGIQWHQTLCSMSFSYKSTHQTIVVIVIISLCQATSGKLGPSQWLPITPTTARAAACELNLATLCKGAALGSQGHRGPSGSAPTIPLFRALEKIMSCKCLNSSIFFWSFH